MPRIRAKNERHTKKNHTPHPPPKNGTKHKCGVTTGPCRPTAGCHFAAAGRLPRIGQGGPASAGQRAGWGQGTAAAGVRGGGEEGAQGGEGDEEEQEEGRPRPAPLGHGAPPGMNRGLGGGGGVAAEEGPRLL